jgi:hypothetical protein
MSVKTFRNYRETRIIESDRVEVEYSNASELAPLAVPTVSGGPESAYKPRSRGSRDLDRPAAFGRVLSCFCKTGGLQVLCGQRFVIQV